MAEDVDNDRVDSIDLSEDGTGMSKELPVHVANYINVVLYVANFVRTRAAQGDVTTDQLIEVFGRNVRKVLDPDFKEH